MTPKSGWKTTCTESGVQAVSAKMRWNRSRAMWITSQPCGEPVRCNAGSGVTISTVSCTSAARFMLCEARKRGRVTSENDPSHAS